MTTESRVRFFDIAKKAYFDFGTRFIEIAKISWYWIVMITIADFIAGYPYPCSFYIVRGNYFNCSDSILARVLLTIFQAIIFSFFIASLISFFNDKTEEKFNLAKFLKKALAVLILFIVFVMPLASFYILLMRETNSHTLIELAIFFLAMIPFFGPFYFIRLILAPVLVEDDAKFLGIIDSIKNTSSNFLRIVAGLFLCLGVIIAYLLIPKIFLIAMVIKLGIFATVIVSALFNAVVLAQIAVTAIFVINLKRSLV